MTRIITVIGPPAAGKTSYVAKHIRDGEICIDLDLISQALTFQKKKPGGVLPLVIATGAILPSLATKHGIPTVWQITTRWKYARGSHVIVIHAPITDLIARASKRAAQESGEATPRKKIAPPLHHSNFDPTIIRQWFTDYGAPYITEAQCRRHLPAGCTLEIIDNATRR
jgi:hypothetical protein